jgi:hypothetical protein
MLAVLTALALLPLAGASAVPRRPERVIGHDGVEYESAPLVVNGLDNDLYLGLEFDLLCTWGGDRLERGMTRLARLARLIERSGRRVVFTIAPDKTLINWENVDKATLPQGTCDRQGMRQQRRVLDRFPDPSYLSMRKALDADPRQTYWKTDGHWTTIGASDWVTELARELDPKLANRLRFHKSSITAVGYLNKIRGIDTPETVPGVRYAGRVKVRTAPDSPDDLTPGGALSMDHRWNSAPAGKTWPGRTLLIGDSFTLMALELLRPLFRHGRYVWTGNVPLEDIAEGVADSDTVVIEVVQFFVYGGLLSSPKFHELVKKALRKHRQHHS